MSTTPSTSLSVCFTVLIFHKTHILTALHGDMYLVLSKVVEKCRKYEENFHLRPYVKYGSH
jgi:hypothetical protein